MTRAANSRPREAIKTPAGVPAPRATRASLMTYRSVASRKRAAATRLQIRAGALLAEAAALDGLAEQLMASDKE